MSKSVFSACLAALIIVSFGQAATIHNAVIRGDIPAIEQLLKSQPQLLEERDQFGCTPLHIAAREGNLGIAKMLVKKGAAIDA
ncbi:MAG TPA: ankyrin repeat domain-containing protein, partial [bacterium]